MRCTGLDAGDVLHSGGIIDRDGGVGESMRDHCAQQSCAVAGGAAADVVGGLHEHGEAFGLWLELASTSSAGGSVIAFGTMAMSSCAAWCVRRRWDRVIRLVQTTKQTPVSGVSAKLKPAMTFMDQSEVVFVSNARAIGFQRLHGIVRGAGAGGWPDDPGLHDLHVRSFAGGEAAVEQTCCDQACLAGIGVRVFAVADETVREGGHAREKLACRSKTPKMGTLLRTGQRTQAREDFAFHVEM